MDLAFKIGTLPNAEGKNDIADNREHWESSSTKSSSSQSADPVPNDVAEKKIKQDMEDLFRPILLKNMTIENLFDENETFHDHVMNNTSMSNDSAKKRKLVIG